MIVRRLAGRWDRFWFAPEDSSALAVFRIAFGAVMTVWTLGLSVDLFTMFSAGGIVPIWHQPVGGWSLLTVFPGRPAVVVIWFALLVGCIALTVGYRTRLAALFVFVGITSFEYGSPWVFNSGDTVLRILALMLVLAPAGAALSVDRLRRAPGSFWQCPALAPWVIRLIQIQVSVIYLTTVWAKLRTSMWRDGTAVSYSTRLGLERFSLPHWVTDSQFLVAWATHGTLLVELSMGVLVWNRRLRPYVLAAGVGLHLTIELTMSIGVFSWAMLVAYIAFLPPEWVNARLSALREFLDRRRKVSPGTLPAPRKTPARCP